MINIGLIGTQSMHAWAFAQACNIPDSKGNYNFPDARVTAVYGVDDTEEHIKLTLEKGNIPTAVSSLEELMEHCNAFMILQRRGGEHMEYADQLIRKGYPVFIDKPVCCTLEDMKRLQAMAAEHDAVICGGSGLKYNKQIRELKQQIAAQAFGPIKGATINHSADMDSPYDGIFFYLPHAVEMMLELFGYHPVSVKTTVFSHNNFTVCVKYEEYMINLAINSSSPCFVVVNGKNGTAVQVNSGDIFLENMRNFVTTIEQHEVTKDTDKLTKHVAIILAVQESMEKDTEVKIIN
ncbi:MAG: Gfo/Idh/MocA family oxidoreductase [Lachnospiraceae bacterium]|nr:Gfo/Idh/MocA family oxidoreductase [Lachnospiraceae bacterium]MBR3807527.1 Gfo/Idh/MocA family oxidoreductase [Lachnospiraceae bacterium]MBR4061291.1 Gfo/Idh/MocA family oxidoreductase [Lachnospiraceae bacterium]